MVADRIYPQTRACPRLDAHPCHGWLDGQWWRGRVCLGTDSTPEDIAYQRSIERLCLWSIFYDRMPRALRRLVPRRLV